MILFLAFLQVVGNLLYYRYINSAIVAPDAFDIIKVSPEHKLNNAQRRNLASIAKILQFAASKKGKLSFRINFSYKCGDYNSVFLYVVHVPYVEIEIYFYVTKENI